MAKINPLLFGVALFCPVNDIYAVTLDQFNPGTNDDLAGVLNVPGNTESLTGNQRFAMGVDGRVNTTLGNVTVVSGGQFINRARLEPGPQNYAITVPDAITGGNSVFQVYNPANLVALPVINNATVVADIRNVNDNQYINTRVANISNGGTLNVSIGSGTASSTADTHAWIMAAKQSSLFNVDGNSATASTLNWNNNNRISFIGSAATPTSGSQAQASYIVQDVANFKGAFSVQTLNGSSSSFNVTSAAELKAYNDWLIDQLQAGNLDKARYLSEFNKAFSRSNENIVYLVSATVPDEATLPTGKVVAINADGPNAVVNVAAGRTLEVAGATRGAINASRGAQVNIYGKLSSQGDDFNGITDSAALWLDASSADNNGVINGGFLNRATASNDGVGQTSYNANGIQLLNGSDFTNNGVVNFATTGSTTTNTSGVAAINLGANGRADNAGNLNVGVNGSSASGTTSGVLLSSASATFTNTADGVIYLGRGPQNSKSEAVAETAINQSGLTSGIALLQGGRAINYGRIVTGTRVQNSAAMFASGSASVMLNNSGVIDVNGQAASVPRENSAMLVLNAGSAGGIINAGTLNLNGVNGSGLKVVATGANNARASSTGVINVAGGADAASGTRNYGVWAEGQGSGSANATIDGAVNLTGNGAIGVHARGRALVQVTDDAVPLFRNGSNQLGFFAYGEDADIQVANSRPLTVATSGSTLFRLEQGADLNTAGMTLVSAGAGSFGVLGSGSGSDIVAQNSHFSVTGAQATGLRIEGGATADVAAATTLALEGNGSTGIIVDNLRTSLNNALTGEAAAARVTSRAQVTGNGNNALGFEVANGGWLSRSGILQLQGDDSTALRIRGGGVIVNNDEVNIASGTGLEVVGAGDARLQGGAIGVADGIAAVRIGNQAQLMLSDSEMNTAGTADGVLLDAQASSLQLSDSRVNVAGTGHGLNNRAATSHITLNNVAITVNDGDAIRTSVLFDDPATAATLTVQGRGTGFDFTQEDGSPAAADLLLGAGYHISVTGAGGNGIRAHTSGAVDNLADVTISHPEGGSALVSDTAQQVLNRATLQSRSLAAPVVALSGNASVLENRGAILAAEPALPAIVTAAGDDRLLLSAGAVVGDVQTGAGSDSVEWRGGSLNGGLALGAGDNNQALVQAVDLSETRHITSGAGAGNTLTLAQVAGRGGSFADGDDTAKGTNLGTGWSTINFVESQWALTDNLQLLNSEVNIDAASTLLAGNNVHPLIAADVRNAGVIDLTNGAGSPGNTLTIDGDLISDAGQLRLLTRLNEGGALENQFSDQLRVNGNASSGVTRLDVTPDSLSNGNLTDSDHNGQVDADEGISLVQVSGTAQAQSFALSGGYLAAGPWQYQLYPFAPGSSDASQRQVAGGSDNAYWDYRLGNLYVCETGCPVYVPPPLNPAPGEPAPDNPSPGNPPPGSPAPDNPAPVIPRVARPAVIPQVPAYLSAPVGLAYYTAAVVDDLHKRLGELRDAQAASGNTGGEFFLRYIGASLRYQSDRRFTDFGYNLDIDYSAMQLGGNMLKWEGDSSTLRAGVAWTRGNTRLQPHAADGISSTTFDSDSVAFYSTWLHHSGGYLDGAFSVDWHRGETDIQRQQRVAKLKGRGWSASLESGYPFALAHGIRLEPQAQLMHMQLNMADFTDREGARVQYGDYQQTIGRLGVRLDRSWTDRGGRHYTPWFRINYWQGWGDGAKTRVSAQSNPNLQHVFDGGRFGQTGELGIGGTVNLKNNLALYAEADYRRAIDNNGAQGWRYNLGVRWRF